MSEHNDAVSERRILVFFWKATLKYKRLFLGGLLMPLGYLTMSTFFPYYVGKLLAALGTNAHQAPKYLPFLVGIGIVGVLANRLGTVCMFRLQAQVWADLHALGLRTLLAQSVGFHNNRVGGKLVTDAIEFPQAYNMLSNAFMVNIIPLVSSLTIGVLLVAFKSWLLGLLLLGMVFVTLVAAILQSNRRKPLRVKRQKASKALTAHTADAIVNNQTVKTFAREDYEMQQHSKLNDVLLDIRVTDWASGARGNNNRMIGLVIFQLLFAFLIIGLVERDPGLLAVGIFAFTYSVTLSNSMFSIVGIVRQTEDAFVQAAPMLEVIDAIPTIQDKPHSTELVVTQGAITFKNVGFSYQDSSSTDDVFTDLNLDIKPGEKIGLVGTSGGGKTTLTRLLLRFDDIQAGSICIDGQNIADVTQNSLRSAIAYVPQEPLMFHRSVAENIAYGDLTAAHKDIVRAAKHANADTFIKQLPAGYDTLVGERGVKLSGGQRQRVAIARAVLKNAPILVLDEATSALDSESEVLIQQALQDLMRDRTAIVVAHRLSTIQKMDRIVVLQDGSIKEQGSHKDLLKKNGVYAKLWNHQSGGFLED